MYIDELLFEFEGDGVRVSMVVFASHFVIEN